MPTMIDQMLTEFDEKFLGCDFEGCAGIHCSKHQFKKEVSGRMPSDLQAFVTARLKKLAKESLGAVPEKERLPRSGVEEYRFNQGYNQARSDLQAFYRKNGLID
jgi:hypothetical protein